MSLLCCLPFIRPLSSLTLAFILCLPLPFYLPVFLTALIIIISPSVSSTHPSHHLSLSLFLYFTFLPIYLSSVVLFDLLVNILGHNLAEPAYEAEVAQLEYKLVAGEHGLVIKVKGFNHKLPVSECIRESINMITYIRPKMCETRDNHIYSTLVYICRSLLTFCKILFFTFLPRVRSLCVKYVA